MKINIGGKTFEISKEQIEKGEDIAIHGEYLVRTKDEEETFLNNIKSETSKAAIEIEVKKLRNDLGLEFEGKTVKKLVEALTEKNRVEFTKDPNDQLTAKEKDIQTLKQKIQEIEEEKNKVATEFGSYKNELTLEREIRASLPANLSIPEEDIIMIIKNRLKPSVDEGKVVFKKGDDILKDSTTLEPLAAKKVLEDFFAENKSYVKAVDGGKGGQDDPGNAQTNNREAWLKKYESAGGDMSSESVNRAMMEAIKNKEFQL